MESTALLLEDHKQISRALKILEEMALRAKHGQKPNGGDVTQLLEFLDGFGDRLHQAREEGILFPALLQDRKQENYPRLRKLMFEHEELRSLIQGLKESALTVNAKDFVFCATRLVEILCKHIKEEETVLFPLADSTLSHAEDARAAAEMRGYDKSWESRKLSTLLRQLDDLESRYLGKTHAKAHACRENLAATSTSVPREKKRRTKR